MSRCDSYTFGNCTRGACDLAGWVPDGLGDGGDWAANAPSHGLVVIDQAVPGSIVCYCRGDGYSTFGHVGMVEDVYGNGTFKVKEMNFAAFDQYDERVSNYGDVCGFIVPAGGVPTGSGAGGGPPAQSPVWTVAHEWDNMRWYLQTGSLISRNHLSDLARWFDGIA